MNKKQIITIAGKPGSGKSTTSKLLAQQLGYTHYSTGDFFREIGSSMGLDVLAANKAATQSDIDHRVDMRQKKLGEDKDRFVIDARLGWHWIPCSFKVYLDLDLAIAARRILASTPHERLMSEQLPDDPLEYEALLAERLAHESSRYRQLYDVDPSDQTNYDLIVQGDSLTPEEIVAMILKQYHRWSSQ